ncbi:MAG: hypothetical protein AAF658_22675, partial [Myxococcota bacterium]
MSLLEDVALASCFLFAAVFLGTAASYLGGQRDLGHYRASAGRVFVNLVLVELSIVAVCSFRATVNPWWEHDALWMFVTFFLVVDALAWAGHWLMHTHPHLIPLHAGVHHAQREPYGPDQFFQHPLDNLVTFTLPGALTFSFVPMSLPLASYAFAVAVLCNILAHGPFGWEHRQHHLGEPVSLGGGVWFDWLMGTSKDSFAS